MGKAIWFSRHSPLPKQIRLLKEKGIIIVAQIPYIPDIGYALEKIRQYKPDYIIPVIPLSLIMKLFEVSKAMNFTILYAEMEKVHEGECKNCYFDPDCDVIYKSNHYRFREFKVIKDIKIVFEDF
jgi:hypothetical protein